MRHEIIFPPAGAAPAAGLKPPGRTKNIFFAVFLLCSAAFPARAAKLLPETILQIRVLRDAKAVNIGSNRDFYMFNPSTGKTRLSSRNIYLVRAEGNYIMAGNKRFSCKNLQFIPYDAKSFIYVNGKPYRDIIYVRRWNKTLTVINEVGLENYLYGVVPREMDVLWPGEALKAQAVISRTFAVLNRGKHEKDGYNLCNDVCCQVYGGLNAENARTSDAVDETRGEVLTFKGKLANTVYHSCCGGFTERATDIWKTYCDPPEYLRGVTCRFCTKSKHYTWENRLSEETIRRKLAERGYLASFVSGIKIENKTKTGRSKSIAIIMRKKNRENVKVTMNSNDFRLMISPWLVKSTYFTGIYKEGGDFVFKGRGWGHAVGLCQWGAKGMAEKDYSYKQILKYYYPNTKIELWKY